MIQSAYRKFKGLEADAVILVDVDFELLNPDNINGEKALYVSSSRAKFELSIICEVGFDEVVEILQRQGVDKNRANKRPFKTLATYLNSKYMDKN